MSSQEPTISNFLNGKPSIEPVEQSSILSRLRQFLPQMEAANQQMAESASGDAFQIEKVSDSSSDDSSDDSDSEEDEPTEEQKTTDDTKYHRIEIDLDVFREQNSVVDGRDVSVQSVESLPAAFHSETTTTDSPTKKVLIEEM